MILMVSVNKYLYLLYFNILAVTEVYWWDMSGATIDHDRDSSTIQGVSLAHPPIQSNYSPGAFQ